MATDRRERRRERSRGEPGKRRSEIDLDVSECPAREHIAMTIRRAVYLLDEGVQSTNNIAPGYGSLDDWLVGYGLAKTMQRDSANGQSPSQEYLKMVLYPPDEHTKGNCHRRKFLASISAMTASVGSLRQLPAQQPRSATGARAEDEPDEPRGAFDALPHLTSLDEELLGPKLDLDLSWAKQPHYQRRLGEDRWSAPLPASMWVAHAKAGFAPLDAVLRGTDTTATESITIADLAPIGNTTLLATSELGTTREILGHVKAASDAMAKWADAAENWKSGIRSLDSINKLIEGCQLFSKLSVGLGLIGAGLGILSVVLSLIGEDANTRILKAIERLDGKIDDLKQTMLQHFDQLRNQNEFNLARAQIAPHTDFLDALRTVVKQYHDAVEAEDAELIAEFKQLLGQFKTTDVLQAVTGIFSQSREGNFKSNIFESLFRVSYGNLQAIGDVGVTLVSYAAFGLQAHALLASLEKSPKNDDERLAMAATTGRVVAGLYQDKITGVTATLAEYRDRCVSELGDNVQRRMTIEILPRLAGPRQEAAKSIVERLAAQWFWTEWTGVLYDPVKGLTQHGAGGWNRVEWAGQQTGIGQLNVAVHWAKKDRPVRTAPPLPKLVSFSRTNKIVREFKDTGGKIQRSPDNFKAEPLEIIREIDKTGYIEKTLGAPGWIWVCRNGSHESIHSTNPERLQKQVGKNGFSSGGGTSFALTIVIAT